MYYLKQKLKKAERKASLPDTMSRPAAIGNQRLTGGNRGESSGIKSAEAHPRITRQGTLSSYEAPEVE